MTDIYPRVNSGSGGEKFKDFYQQTYQQSQNYQYKAKTEDWVLPTESYDEINIEKNAKGEITGPWPDVMKAYTNLTAHGEPECSDCETEMLHGDRSFLCPVCNNECQVGVDDENIIVIRDDVRPGFVDQSPTIPEGYFKNFVLRNSKTSKSLSGMYPNVSISGATVAPDMKKVQQAMENVKKNNFKMEGTLKYRSDSQNLVYENK